MNLQLRYDLYKAERSEVLERVKAGEEIVISYGRKKENIAVIVPYGSFKKENRIVTGLRAQPGTIG